MHRTNFGMLDSFAFADKILKLFFLQFSQNCFIRITHSSSEYQQVFNIFTSATGGSPSRDSGSLSNIGIKSSHWLTHGLDSIIKLDIRGQGENSDVILEHSSNVILRMPEVTAHSNSLLVWVILVTTVVSNAHSKLTGVAENVQLTMDSQLRILISYLR